MAVQTTYSENSAKKVIRDHDVTAYELTDFVHRREAYDSSLNDLVIPFEGLTEKTICENISREFSKTSVLRTTESRSAGNSMKLTVEIGTFCSVRVMLSRSRRMLNQGR